LASHRVYGEAVAILTSDALFNHAFKLIIANINRYNYIILSKVIEEICEALGLRGVIGGQAEEMLVRNKKINLATLEDIYNRKTAALICASIRIGAILAKAKPKELFSLTRYGKNLGFAYQLLDDITEAEEEDIKKGELNCFSLMTIKEAKEITKREINQAQKSLMPFGKKAKILSKITEYIINRKI